MKLKNKLIQVLVMSGIIVCSSFSFINADESSEKNLNEVINLKPIECKGKEDGWKREKIRDGGLNELKEKGILDDNDINNIRKYMEENKDEIKKEMYERKIKEIDNMVSENVISKEKGEALKKHVGERFESRDKNK